MRYFAYIAAVSALALASCGNGSGNTAAADSSSTTAAPAPNGAPSSKLGDSATTELLNLVSSYYHLKDALVASDAAKADAAAAKLMSDAEGFHQISGKQPNATALDPQVMTIQQESEAIVNTKADSIETKRAHFSKVSDAMFALLKASELRNAGVYQQYCPMAFNDQGGYWLSPEEKIMNPYLPKKMLHCGEVRDSM